MAMQARTTSFLRRRSLQAALALAAGFLVHAAPAQAEIIDFDPATADVPVLIKPADLERFETLAKAGFWYMITEPSPGGRYVYAWDGAGEGFVDLQTGAKVAPAYPEGFPAAVPVTNLTWLDATTLASLNVETTEGEMGQPPVETYYRMEMNAVTGAVTAVPIDVAVDGSIVSASPDLRRVVVMQSRSGAPPLTAETVVIGPKYRGPQPAAPEGVDVNALPGRVGGDGPLKTLSVQQAAFDLVVQNLDGTAKTTLMTAPADTSAGATWSPDGARIVVETYNMPNWDGDRRRDNNPPFAGLPNLGSIAVQESLGQIAPAQNPIVAGGGLYVFDAAAGSELKAFKGVDFQQGLLYGIRFSPNHKRALLSIARRSELDGRKHPVYSTPSGFEWHLLDADLKIIRKIEAPDLDSLGASAAWMGDDMLVFAAPHDTDTRIVAVDAASGMPITLWDKPGNMYQAMPAGTGAVFSHSTVDEPWELWTVTGDLAPTVRQITNANRAARLASGVKFADVSWKDSDGRTLSGIYAYPEHMAFPPAQPQPMVVWQLGGPGGQMGNDFGNSVESPTSLLPNFGIPVFIANAAGRNVKSAAFYSDMAQGRNFGQLDIRQIKEGVDALVKQGVADPKRVGISGCSYGGYFTLQSLRTYPGFYAAGNPQCSLVDLTEEFTFGYTPIVSYLMGRAPMADPDEYVKDSPYYGAKDITTPTLIFHGTKDFLPVPLINNIHDELDGRGVDVRFLRAAGYGHGLGMAMDPEGKPIAGSPEKGQRYAFQLQLQFFREHLKVDEIPAPTHPAQIFLPVAGQSSVMMEPEPSTGR